MVIIQCASCAGVLTEQGLIWQCEGEHPEVQGDLQDEEQIEEE